MAPTDPPAPAPPRLPSRLAAGVRHAVRQVATAVYAYVALYGLVFRFAGSSPLAVLAGELALAFAGAALLTLAVEAPLAGTALVGVVVGLFDLGVAWVAGEGDLAPGRLLLAEALPMLAVSLAGLAGTLAVRRRQARRRVAPPRAA